jgi:hypothetical protein
LIERRTAPRARAALLKISLISVCCFFLLIKNANAVNCRGFAKEAQTAIKTHVAALQRLEHEASDRFKGLDSRPFEFLRDEARRTAATIADPIALKDEEGLERCRNATRPIRKICAASAQLLVEILEKHVANPKPDYDKPHYAEAMGSCEKLMDLKPLKSVIRGTD